MPWTVGALGTVLPCRRRAGGWASRGEWMPCRLLPSCQCVLTGAEFSVLADCRLEACCQCWLADGQCVLTVG